MDSLKSLDYPSFDVYLVDNGSQRESVNAILNYLNNGSFYSIDLIQNENLSNFTKTNDSNIVFILNENNSGFAGGNNVALNYIKDNVPTGYVMLLNNDTIVTSDLLTGLVTKFNESDDTGFVGANHYYYHDKNRMQTVGGGSIDMVHGECMAITTNGITDEFDFLTGSCILMSCEVLRKVGVLNEDYFSFVDNKKESEEEFNKMKELCKENRQLEIIDFDDHLENPNLDWRNIFLE